MRSLPGHSTAARTATSPWSPYELDGRAWEEIGALYDETLERTMEIAVEASDRLDEARPSGGTLRATFVQLAFESPVGSSRSDLPR